MASSKSKTNLQRKLVLADRDLETMRKLYKDLYDRLDKMTKRVADLEQGNRNLRTQLAYADIPGPTNEALAKENEWMKVVIDSQNGIIDDLERRVDERVKYLKDRAAKAVRILES